MYTNCIYRPPKYRNYLNTSQGTHETWIRDSEKFPHSKQGTYKHWFHESTENAFSVHQYAKNLLTQSLAPLKRGFWLDIFAFSGLKNEKISTLLARYLWNIGFANRRKSHFQDAKMRKNCSHEASYHWTLGFTTRQISQFLASKMQKMSWRILGVHETVGFRTRQNRIFWLPSAGRLPSIDFTLSINSLSSFRQLTIQFPSIDHPVSVSRPSSFLQEYLQFPSIIRPVSISRPSSFRQ